MNLEPTQLRRHALAIWHAGLQAVRPEILIPQYLAVGEGVLWIDGDEIPLGEIDRILVVGGGKAGAGMTRALEHALGPDVLRGKRVTGLVNVPADCVGPTSAIRLQPARPAGINEPHQAGVDGAAEMLRLVATLGPRDLCLVLLSGGGSALLPAPIERLSLDQKRILTRELSARGASIDQLNTVRRELSRFKGGGLARACSAGRLYALILSDVLGDDLATIASGPTVARQPTPERAIDVLRRFELAPLEAGRQAVTLLERLRQAGPAASPSCRVRNIVIGNNATAVDAAGIEAERRGFSHAMISAGKSEGAVEEVAERIAEMIVRMRRQPGPDCLISGGEPTVTLAPESERGLGGRSQQLCLAALAAIDDWRDAALVSGGTDGEDGPTDAAGAMVDLPIVARAQQLGLDPHDFLRRNDAYHFFEAVDGLVKTGPTHTNVCDLRVVAVGRST